MNDMSETVGPDESGDSDDEVAEFEPGQVIVGGYRAWEVLGSGPRCETWLAWSDRLRVPVALKIPRVDMYEHPSPRIALTREVEALRRIAHPSFPRLLDADLTGAMPYMATEYVEGPTLSGVLEDEGPFSATEVALLGAQIAIALGHLHDSGLVHHDVKPHNVMLHNGRITLIDLGFVEPIGATPLPGGPRGTDGYMAPEQRAGEPNTAASDVFSLGLLLLELLTGAVDPDTTDATDWVAPRLAAASRNADLPTATLLPALERMCAPDPLARPRGCDEIIALLRPALPGNDVPWPSFVDGALLDGFTVLANCEPAGRGVIPWIATWTSEAESVRWSRPETRMIEPMGLPEGDPELVAEARSMWLAHSRTVRELGGLRGVGAPIFNRLHPARQRLAMLEGRCSVCGRPVPPPWTFVGHLSEEGRTPAFREPPLCEQCLPVALATCPGLGAYVQAGTLSIVSVDGYMPVPDLAGSDDDDEPVEYFLAIPMEHAWRPCEPRMSVT